MSINFIPNDPMAGSKAPKVRVQPKHANRPATKAGFTLSDKSPEDTFEPGTREFLFWQCREAALATVDAWETFAGALKKWQGNRKKLQLVQDDGVEELNAGYDRDAFSFSHELIGSKMFFAGASTDVVAHEVGHGLLDVVRPDLWDVTFLEAAAFHEAFGDCIAMLAALNDKQTRKKLLSVTKTLRKRNFVESVMESLAEGTRLTAPDDNSAEPRRARNSFKFQLPSTLPTSGGPGELINEVHSFGMVFTGCFWDLIANLLGEMSAKNEANLQTAAQMAGRLLIEGSKVAVVTPRFFQSVGRGMVLADQNLNGGANGNLIRDAFKRHDILLGSNAMVAPSMALEGAAPTKGAALAAATRRDLVRRLGAGKGAKLSLESTNLFGTHVVRAVHKREVSLGAVDNRLKGVVALVPETTTIGASGRAAALVGALPDVSDTEREARTFAQSLLEHGQIALGKTTAAKAVGAKMALAEGRSETTPTHVVRVVGGKKVLRRVRFRC